MMLSQSCFGQQHTARVAHETKSARRGWRRHLAVQSSSAESQQPAALNSPPTTQQQGSAQQAAAAVSRRSGLLGLGLLSLGAVSEQLAPRQALAEEFLNDFAPEDVVSIGREGDEFGGAQPAQPIEIPPPQQLKEVTTPEGLRYVDLVEGEGWKPEPGFVIAMHYRAFADGELFVDSKTRVNPLVFFYKSRPLPPNICPGVELALATMKEGGTRAVKIPSELGFGPKGIVLTPLGGDPFVVPPNAELEYEIQLLTVAVL